MTGKYLIIDRYGVVLGVKEGRFILRTKEKNKWVTLADAAPPEIDSIIIATDGASITSSAVMLAAEHGIDLVFLTWKGPIARTISATYGSTAWLWLEQLKQATDRARRTELSASFVEGKIRNQATLLRIFRKVEEAAGRRKPELRRTVDELMKYIKQLNRTADLAEVAQLEAAAARAYWEGVRSLLPRSLGFTKRLKKWSLPNNQKPDPFNSALNIGYSILAKEVWRAVFIAGLNPYIGFLHEKRPGRMSLVYDLMEEFRPVAVDRPIIKLARKNPSALKPLKEKNTERSRKAARLVSSTVIKHIRETKPPIKNLIMTQARTLAKSIRTSTSYTPYIMKY